MVSFRSVNEIFVLDMSNRSAHFAALSAFSFSRTTTHGIVDKAFGWKELLSKTIWMLQVQSQQQLKLTGNTYYNLTLVPSYVWQNWKSVTMVQIRGSVWDSAWTPEKGQRTYRPKHCDYNNEDEINSPNVLIDNNYLVSSQKFRQISSCYYGIFN